MAQSYAPEETPPASFKGRQYVDSAGCVFVRAGYGDATKWVPRINRDRTAVCGFKPSLPAAKVAAPAPAPAPAQVTPAPAQVAPAKPAIAKAVLAPKIVAPVTRSDTPTRRAQKAPMATIASNMTPAVHRSNSPYYPVKTRAPRVVAPPVVPQIPHEVSVGGLAPVVTTSSQPHGGWKPAFTDGRLNPYRGGRTQAGDAQMAQRWNTKTPMEMVAAPQQRVIYVPVARVSTKSVAPAAPQTRQRVMSAKRFVQVGSFGVPSNAAGAKARLRALGLPVATGRSGGLTVIYAGPFAGPSALEDALAQTRRAGFTDALLR